MVECKCSKEDLKKISEVVNVDDIQVYLRPDTSNFGSAGAASKIASVKDASIEEVEDYVTEGDNFALSRLLLEIVAIIPGYFKKSENGDKEFVLFEEEEDYGIWWSYEECLHIPIGCVTGYVVDKKEFASANEDEMGRRSIAIKFDCISQILSDFWFVIARGKLSYLIEEYEEYIMEDENKVLYYLDDIYYKEGFENVKIDRAAIRLLESAIKDYLSKELEEIVYEPYRSDFFTPVGLIDGDNSVYIDRAKMLKQEGFKLVKETGFDLVDEMDYYVKSVNGYNDIYGEEIVVNMEDPC